ncbi:MAG: hypothetical protein ACI8XO_003468 [Verrucomicrobiales bacterium]|jgi:hypothetical protein
MKFSSSLRIVRSLLLACVVVGSGACKKKPEPAAPEVEVLDPLVLEELAVEERQLEKIRKGWKAKTYRGTRKGVIRGALGLIGAVEGQEAHPMLQNLPAEVREVIAAAGGEAGELKALAADPPAEVGLVVATGQLVHLMRTPALCELDLIDEDGFKTAGGRSGFHVVRGVTYFMHGLKQHGLRDLREANLGSAKNLDPEVRKAIYLGAAAAAISAGEPRMARTQLELAEEMAPGDPAIAFLRAEEEISKQQFVEAKARLEAWREKYTGASGLLPGLIDERIADLSKGDESMVTLLAEPEWLMDFGLDYIAEQSVDSAAFRKLNEVTGAARTLMTDALERVKGFGL